MKVWWECLAEDLVEMVFNSHLWQRFNYIPEVTGDMKTELAIFGLNIDDVAIGSCNSKVADACGNNPRKPLMDTRDERDLQRRSYRAWLACGTPEAAGPHWQAKQPLAQNVADVKTLVWEELSEMKE